VQVEFMNQRGLGDHHRDVPLILGLVQFAKKFWIVTLSFVYDNYYLITE